MGDLGDAPLDYAPDAKPRDGADRATDHRGARPPRARVRDRAADRAVHAAPRDRRQAVLRARRSQRAQPAAVEPRRRRDRQEPAARPRSCTASPRTSRSGRRAASCGTTRSSCSAGTSRSRRDAARKFDVTIYYKILAPVGGAWKIADALRRPAGSRVNGDHEPIDDRCPTSTWQPGDYIIDTFTLTAGGGAFPGGPYERVDRVLHRLEPELEEHAGQRGAAATCATRAPIA